MEESSSTEISIIEISLDNDKDFKYLTINFNLTVDKTLLISHLYLNTLTSYSYDSKLFRPPILI